jgi:hypothetical protein
MCSSNFIPQDANEEQRTLFRSLQNSGAVQTAH